MKRCIGFTKSQLDKIFSNDLINTANVDVFIMFLSEHRDLVDKRRYIKYLSSIKSLDNWDSNYLKFEEYCKNLTHSTAGLYDPVYIALKCNVSVEKAKLIVKDKKTDKTTNLKGFIKRHGVEKGTELYEKFKKTSISAAKSQIGQDECNKRSCWHYSFYTSRGYSYEEARKLAKEHNRNNAGANRTYWEAKGLSEREIDKKMFDLNMKRSKSGTKTMYEKLGFKNYSNDTDEEEYTRLCWLYTGISLSKYSIENIELRGHDHGYSLDHVYSIKAGYINGVEPKYIGHITNLKIVESVYNSAKGARCDKTLDELISEYNLHESKIN